MLARLLVEHDHILKTLNSLETQFLEFYRGITPDYSLVRSTLEYIHEYPEQVHHPLEDQIFSILLERVDQAKVIEELMVEHEQLETETRKLIESVRLVESGVIPTEELMKKLSSFLIRQRQHVYIEEEKVHPLIESVLSEKDWEYVQSVVPLYKGK